MIPLQLATRWNVYGVAPNRRYIQAIQANKNEGIHEVCMFESRDGCVLIQS
jgi:hypothetical protein